MIGAYLTLPITTILYFFGFSLSLSVCVCSRSVCARERKRKRKRKRGRRGSYEVVKAREVAAMTWHVACGRPRQDKSIH